MRVLLNPSLQYRKVSQPRFGMNDEQRARLATLEEAGQAQHNANLAFELTGMPLEKIVSMFDTAIRFPKLSSAYSFEMIETELLSRINRMLAGTTSRPSPAEVMQARLDIETLKTRLLSDREWPENIFEAFMQANRRLLNLPE